MAMDVGVEPRSPVAATLLIIKNFSPSAETSYERLTPSE